MKAGSHTRGYLLVLGATLLWSTLGPLTKSLLANHLPSISIAFLRCVLASTSMFIGLAILRRDLLIAPRATLIQLVTLGCLGVGGFYVALAAGVELAGIALLVVLGYLGSAWVTLFGALFLREPLTLYKIISLVFSLGGAMLAMRLYDLTALSVSWPGVVVCLLASLGNAVFSILSKTLSGRCDQRTMILYAYAVGALVLLPFQNASLVIALQPSLWPALIAIVIGPTLGAWTLFSFGLRWLPVSNAAIVTTLDVVFSSVLAYILFAEWLAPLQLLGGGLIVAAVIVLQLEPKQATQPGLIS